MSELYTLPEGFINPSKAWYDQLFVALPDLIESSVFNLCRWDLLDAMGRNGPRPGTPEEGTERERQRANLDAQYACRERFLRESGYDLADFKLWDRAHMYYWTAYNLLGLEKDPEHIALRKEAEELAKYTPREETDEEFMVVWRNAQERVMNIINAEIDKLQAQGRALNAEKLTMEGVLEHCRSCFR